MDMMKKVMGMKYSLVLLLGLSFIGFSCQSIADKEDESVSKEMIENEIWNPIIILSRKENKMIQAKSTKLYKQKNESALLIGNVEIDFFNDSGAHISILYADSARINEHSNDLNASGNVYVVSDSGYTLSTSKIVWDNSYKMIVAKDSVMFTTYEGDTLYGVGFESDSDLEEWRIYKPIGISRKGI